jgi:hypothetical protein
MVDEPIVDSHTTDCNSFIIHSVMQLFYHVPLYCNSIQAFRLLEPIMQLEWELTIQGIGVTSSPFSGRPAARQSPTASAPVREAYFN